MVRFHEKKVPFSKETFTAARKRQFLPKKYLQPLKEEEPRPFALLLLQKGKKFCILDLCFHGKKAFLEKNCQFHRKKADFFKKDVYSRDKMRVFFKKTFTTGKRRGVKPLCTSSFTNSKGVSDQCCFNFTKVDVLSEILVMYIPLQKGTLFLSLKIVLPNRS